MATATTNPLTDDRHCRDLFAAVCADPFDDGPRLVLADRLDEVGDGERAEFIRVQVELARFQKISPGRLSLLSSEDHGFEAVRLEDPARERLQRRELALLWEYWGNWLGFSYKWVSLGNIGTAAHPDAINVVFRRGFISHLTMRADIFMADGVAAALAKAGPLEGVTLSDMKPDPSARNSSPYAWYRLNEGKMVDEISKEENAVPYDLFDLLTSGKFVEGAWRDYQYPADALADLSLACVNFARLAAGQAKLSRPRHARSIKK